MSKLLIVTDHRFFSIKNKIYDNYVFNYSFFKDYLEIFDEVTIIARIVELDEIPNAYLQTSGECVSFIGIKDVRGAKWFFNNRKYITRNQLDLSRFDAICFRIPSMLAYSVWKINAKRYKLPYMFEFIGDPKESLVNDNDILLKKMIFTSIGSLMENRMRMISKGAACGSYVSFRHLQNKFPVQDGVKTEVISSIRLKDEHILNKLPKMSTDILNIIHVGSFVFIKNQDFLIEFAKFLKLNKFNFRLTFLGDGALIQEMQAKAKDLGLQDNIIFKGHVTGFENIVNLLDENNIFILPSFSEGMPRALIEAMARGLICFGANRGGIIELLEKKFLFDPTSPEEFLKNFNNIINNKELINYSRNRNLDLVKSFEQKKLTSKRRKILKILKSKIK